MSPYPIVGEAGAGTMVRAVAVGSGSAIACYRHILSDGSESKTICGAIHQRWSDSGAAGHYPPSSTPGHSRPPPTITIVAAIAFNRGLKQLGITYNYTILTSSHNHSHLEKAYNESS